MKTYNGLVSIRLLGPDNFVNTLLPNILGLYSFPVVTDRLSLPYKTAGRIMVLYVLISMVLNSKRYVKR